MNRFLDFLKRHYEPFSGFDALAKAVFEFQVEACFGKKPVKQFLQLDRVNVCQLVGFNDLHFG